jgi:hypothetical protein
MGQGACHEVFQTVCNQHQAPTTVRRHKLMELWGRLGGTARELGRINELVSSGGGKWSLVHSAYENKRTGVKSVVRSVAWRLGYEVLPGLKALIGDGVPQAKIGSLFPKLERDVCALLSRLEMVRRKISEDLGHECLLIRRSTSFAQPPGKRGIYLPEKALQLNSGSRFKGSCAYIRPAWSLEPPLRCKTCQQT